MFKKNFYWGAATAAAQIEGGYNADGKSPSIWDASANFKGLVHNGDTSLVTCNHYQHFKQDVKLMKQMGLKAYRFSISWSRLIPDGTGKVNPKGAKFYSDLIDELLLNGIEPFVTLYHWDLPQCLQDKGGWLNPDSPKWFRHYAEKAVEMFDGRVQYIITFNEFEVFINEGLMIGCHAPFYKLPPEVVFNAAHNCLIANGLATIKIREMLGSNVQVGQAHCLRAKVPASNKEQDIAAAKQKMFEGGGRHFWDAWFLEAINKGVYIENRLKSFGNGISYNKADMKIIHQQPDFIGFNTYVGETIKAGENGKPEKLAYPPNTDYTAMNWPVTPDCLYWNAKFLSERYKLPVYVSENGVALNEWQNQNGEINDESRIEYIRTHLKSLEKAANEGVPVDGYFYWSLMDNFEWACGNAKRFGLIRVNFENGERTLKKSAHWYKEVINSNGSNL